MRFEIECALDARRRVDVEPGDVGGSRVARVRLVPPGAGLVCLDADRARRLVAALEAVHGHTVLEPPGPEPGERLAEIVAAAIRRGCESAIPWLGMSAATRKAYALAEKALLEQGWQPGGER
jgi:hypothetical protein